MHEASFYTKLEYHTLRCDLCPWFCTLKPGQTGNCRVRNNENGKLITHVFNKVAAFGIDPIEKKPLYHFYPGKNILSVGEVGCNLHCSFCQNYHISQCFATGFHGFQDISFEKLVEKALQIPQNIGIAYTYNEPFTFYEFMFETAKLAHNKGLKNVVVSNGYVNPEPLRKILPFIDAFNIDLKAFNSNFYKKHTKGDLAPVLETLKIIAASKAHLEITNLVIPGLNDNLQEFESMASWIATELGKDVPLHISRYYPQFEMVIPATPAETLVKLHELAKNHLQHVFTGNVSDEKRSSTFCPECGNLLISRNRYLVSMQNLTKNSACGKCGRIINITL